MEQEFSMRFNGERVLNRNYDEMVGLCKGIIADGKVCHKEAEFLLNWLSSHHGIADCFPGNILVPRLCAMLEDGAFDQEEADDLLSLLQDMTGEKGQDARGSTPTGLAFDDPMPRLTVEGMTFCLTPALFNPVSVDRYRACWNASGDVPLPA